MDMDIVIYKCIALIIICSHFSSSFHSAHCWYEKKLFYYAIQFEID